MMTKDLTLQDFESYIKEIIFETMEFQHEYSDYLTMYDEYDGQMWDVLFKFRERRHSINNMYCAYLSFSFQIEKKELHQYNLASLTAMFKEFIELKKLEDVKSFNVYTDYCSTYEYPFSFDFMIWIEDL